MCLATNLTVSPQGIAIWSIGPIAYRISVIYVTPDTATLGTVKELEQKDFLGAGGYPDVGSSGGNKQGQHLQCIGVFLCVAGRCKLPVRKGCEKLMFFYFIFSEALRLTCTSPVRYVASHSIGAFTVSPSYYHSLALNVAFVSYLTQTILTVRYGPQ